MNLSKNYYPDPRTKEGPCPECGAIIKFWVVHNAPMSSHKSPHGKVSCDIARRKREAREEEIYGNSD